jgi:hypothetical protein
VILDDSNVIAILNQLVCSDGRSGTESSPRARGNLHQNIFPLCPL